MTVPATEVRPFWLTEPCPPWCAKDHHPADAFDERVHTDHGATITLTLHPAWGPLHEPQVLHVSVAQGYRESEPQVELFAVVQNAVIRLTVGEAADLASAIRSAASTAQDAMDLVAGGAA